LLELTLILEAKFNQNKFTIEDSSVVGYDDPSIGKCLPTFQSSRILTVETQAPPKRTQIFTN